MNLNATPEQRKQFISSLASLQNGEAWFWSPAWLGIFERAKVATCKTFDSSKTPEPGETIISPKRAAMDIDKLSAEIKACVERAAANDPDALRDRIHELEGER